MVFLMVWLRWARKPLLAAKLSPKLPARITPNERQRIALAAQEQLAEHRAVFATIQPEEIAKAAVSLADVLCNGGRVFLCGNGGSAACASDIAAHLCAIKRQEAAPFAAHAFADFTTMSQIGNSVGFEHVFAEQVKRWVTKADCFWAFCATGRSENVVAALRAAWSIGALRIGMVPEKTAAAAACSHVVSTKPAASVRIEECNSIAAHAIVALATQLVKQSAEEEL